MAWPGIVTTFRARGGAAPLKRLVTTDALSVVQTFRARSGAAPLKMQRPGDSDLWQTSVPTWSRPH